MDEQLLQTELAELMGEISTLPKSEREKLIALVEKTEHGDDQGQAFADNLRGSLDFLRLSIKYLVFDLEATRRENQYLRQMIEEQEDVFDDDDHLYE